MQKKCHANPTNHFIWISPGIRFASAEEIICNLIWDHLTHCLTHPLAQLQSLPPGQAAVADGQFLGTSTLNPPNHPGCISLLIQPPFSSGCLQTFFILCCESLLQVTTAESTMRAGTPSGRSAEAQWKQARYIPYSYRYTQTHIKR